MRSNMALGIERALTSCSRRAEGWTFQSSRPLPSSRILWGSITGVGRAEFLFLRRPARFSRCAVSGLLADCIGHTHVLL